MYIYVCICIYTYIFEQETSVCMRYIVTIKQSPSSPSNEVLLSTSTLLVVLW